jgi:hypothetical protein
MKQLSSHCTDFPEILYLSIFRKSVEKIQVSVKPPRWMIKATNTHLKYVIPIAFPPQQWLRERASKLSYTHIA